MDNNYTPYNSPSTEYSPAPKPPRVTNKFINILLALLKCAGYVATWLGVQFVLMLGFILFTYIANPTLSYTEIVNKVYGLSMELTLITNILTLVLFVLFYIIIKKPFLKTIKAKAPHKASYLPTIAIGGSAQYVTALILGMIILILPKEWVDSFNQNNELIENANQAVSFITAVIMAPLFEEILCRGLILNTLRGAMPKWWAIVLSSAIFGIIHGNPIQFIYATALGILLGWLYTKFDSIYIPMLCHLVFNLMSMINSYLDPENMVVTLILGLVMFVSIPVFALSVVYICLKKFDKPKAVSVQAVQNTEATPRQEYNADALSNLEREIEGKNNNINGD